MHHSQKNKYSTVTKSSVFLQVIKCIILKNLFTTTNMESQGVLVRDNFNRKSWINLTNYSLEQAYVYCHLDKSDTSDNLAHIFIQMRPIISLFHKCFCLISSNITAQSFFMQLKDNMIP